MMKTLLAGALALLIGLPPRTTLAHDGPAIDEDKIIDLTHTFDEHAIAWPTARQYELEVVSAEHTPNGYWYAANNICLAEHSGTHLDAPLHFAHDAHDASEVPLSRLIGPAVVVDVRQQASQNADYRLTKADLLAWEKAHGRIPDGAIVLMLSGWGQFWLDRKRYLGSDAPGDAMNLHFPGFSAEAAEFLRSERVIDAIGVDTPSLDYGQSRDFIVHRIVSRVNMPGLENIAQLEKLPPAGAQLIALPMKIARGSGGPTRIIAILP